MLLVNCMNPILFVGGIHGAGKSTICGAVAEQFGALHVTASKLIKQAAAAGYTVTVAPESKSVPDVDQNQALLLQGLERFKKTSGEHSIILDGHFCLLDSESKFAVVPAAVFRAISPVALLLVETDAAVVRARQESRNASHLPSIDQIAAHASAERLQAQTVSALLSIPLEIVRGDQAALRLEPSVGLRLRSSFGGGRG
jgi:adenylate kinase